MHRAGGLPQHWHGVHSLSGRGGLFATTLLHGLQLPGRRTDGVRLCVRALVSPDGRRRWHHCRQPDSLCEQPLRRHATRTAASPLLRGQGSLLPRELGGGRAQQQRTRACTHTCMHAHIHACMQVSEHTHACMRAPCMHACVHHASMHAQVATHACIHTGERAQQQQRAVQLLELRLRTCRV